MKYIREIKLIVVGTSVGMLLILACTHHDNFRKNYKDVNSLIHDNENIDSLPFLKAHTKSGEVYIFQKGWEIDTISENISGIGKIYDYHRNFKNEGDILLEIDSIAIFETNSKIKTSGKNARIAALGIMTALDLALGIYCVTVPKACWGSCPTFYLKDDNHLFSADAEGFSNAISPSLEKSDIDALNSEFLKSDTFSLTMKNEALETHVVKDLKILAYPRKYDEQVYHSVNDKFYLCNKNIAEPILALCPEGDCTESMLEIDKKERFSLADSTNLSSKEEIILEFDLTSIKNKGLILNFRQTLMTTYFIYSALGYMGDEVGDFFAKIERNPEIEEKFLGIQKELGGIEIYTLEDNKWELQGTFFEHGPIAKNLKIMPLHFYGNKKNKFKVKLKLNKGLWRIDFAAIAEIKNEVKPITLNPNSVSSENQNNFEALHNILDSNRALISMPGDVYSISFKLPLDNQDYSLFLYSKGYYIEWIRKNWLKEKNPLLLSKMILFPKQYLKDEAKEYKNYEVESEREFWNSRIDPTMYSYHD